MPNAPGAVQDANLIHNVVRGRAGWFIYQKVAVQVGRLVRGVLNPMKAITKVVIIAISKIFSTFASSRAQIVMAEPSQTPIIAKETQGYFIKIYVISNDSIIAAAPSVNNSRSRNFASRRVISKISARSRSKFGSR